MVPQVITKDVVVNGSVIMSYTYFTKNLSNEAAPCENGLLVKAGSLRTLGSSSNFCIFERKRWRCREMK